MSSKAKIRLTERFDCSTRRFPTISKKNLALSIAIALGVTVPSARSALAENIYGDWGYWSANENVTPQAPNSQAGRYDARSALGLARTTISHPAKKTHVH
jgi:hypothetical protein